MERDDLLHRIRQERARLDEAMSRVPDDRILERDNGMWTGKDHLAHLGVWQRVALARVTGTVPDDIADVVRGEYTEEGIDAINERFYMAGRDRSLKEVRTDFTASYDATCHAVERLNDAHLARGFAGAIKTPVEVRWYPEMYHEVLNDPQRERVLDDVLAFLGARITFSEPR